MGCWYSATINGAFRWRRTIPTSPNMTLFWARRMTPGFCPGIRACVLSISSTLRKRRFGLEVAKTDETIEYHLCHAAAVRVSPTKTFEAGKPLLAHSIEQALQSDAFEAVAVSSDSQKILERGKGLGRHPFDRAPRRPCQSPGTEDTGHSPLP